MFLKVAFVLCCFVLANRAADDKAVEENRPYEFSFNIVDFQHRYEKKDADGIVTGEYGFITADGVYHETGYATDKNGDFIITKMRNRKIGSLKDAQEIFKDNPEAAKKLVEAVAKACAGCKIPVKQTKAEEVTTTSRPVPASTNPSPPKKVGPILKEMMKTLTDNVRTEKTGIAENPKGPSGERKGKELANRVVESMVASAKKLLRKMELETGSVSQPVNENVLEKMANDLYYRFNYTITSHDHQEDGYRSGKKDGSYRAQSENGVDTQVKYLSNEFGHQPNISFVPGTNLTKEDHALKGYSFLWYWQ